MAAVPAARQAVRVLKAMRVRTLDNGTSMGHIRSLANSPAFVGQGHGERPERLILCVEKSGAKVRRPAPVDDRRAHHVRALLEREPFRDAIVDDGLPIAVNADDLL